MGRKGVVIPVSQKADVKPRGYEREFIGEKKCSQRKEEKEQQKHAHSVVHRTFSFKKRREDALKHSVKTVNT